MVISVMGLDKIGSKEGSGKAEGKGEEKSDNRRRFIDIDEPIKKIYMRNIEEKADADSESFNLKLCEGDI